MEKLTDKRKIKAYALLFMVVYLASYITRINFGAIISAIGEAEGYTKASLSFVTSGLFITYGAGQIISGFLGDRIQPKKLLTFGLFASALMNLIIPLCHSTYLMTAVWCVNGFAQAFMWPPIVKVMGELFSAEDYAKACVTVSWGSTMGTILVYLVSPFIIDVLGWRAVFIVCALAGLAGIAAIQIACPDIELRKTVKSAENAKSKSPLFSPVMIFVMVAILLQGALRDGVTTWMPSYIGETFNLGSRIAILTGVVLPLFSIGCFYIASYLHLGKLRNPLICSAVFFGASFAASAVLAVFSAGSPVLSVALSAIISGSMHGVNLMLVCVVPKYFEKYGRISLASGVLNSCTYIGSSLSIYGIAVVCERSGWAVTILLWAGIALAATIICSAFARSFKDKIM